MKDSLHGSKMECRAVCTIIFLLHTAFSQTTTTPPAATPSTATPSAATPSTETPPTATPSTATAPTATEPTATEPTATEPTATEPTGGLSCYHCFNNTTGSTCDRGQKSDMDTYNCPKGHFCQVSSIEYTGNSTYIIERGCTEKCTTQDMKKNCKIVSEKTACDLCCNTDHCNSDSFYSGSSAGGMKMYWAMLIAATMLVLMVH